MMMFYSLEKEFDYKYMKIQNDSLDIGTTYILEKRKIDENEKLKNSNECIEVPLFIKKVNRELIPIPFKGAELERLNRWLFSDAIYQVLEFEGKVYKGMFKKASRWKENAENGFVDVVFEMLDYAYGINCCVANKIRDTRTCKVDNISNAKGIETLETEIYINLKDANVTYIIENLTNGNKMSLTNLESKECLYINSENKYIVSRVDSTRNIYSKFTGSYIKLNKGVNEIKITTNGLTEIDIMHQPIFNNESEVLKCPEIS